ncbi:porin [Thioalkalivibrio sp. ALgr1]|uniref:porin n=1 Tax=Thioalkalivibrio sp. ALgr1 TaxID=748655 RepID=UPI00037DB297|nr:porin [Thioalkalivibrio sp. ALgr1]
MKKQILAVAVAGAFAVPAFAAADTNVTLFGQLQTQVVHHSGSGDFARDFESGFRVHDAGAAGAPNDGANPNRIGVMINHDLGNGLTGLAKIEQNVTSRDGFDSSARDVYVGLDGNFGRVTLGRMSTPYNTAGKDPLNATFMQARTNGGRIGPSGGLGNGSYLNNGLAYSNDFGPVSLDVATFIDNSDDSNSIWSAKLGFDVGPVEVYGAATWADDADVSGVAGSGLDGPGWLIEDARLYKIGADWSHGPFRVVGEIEDVKVDRVDLGVRERGNTYFVSGTYTMGRNDFVLNLGHTRVKDGLSEGDNDNIDYAAFAVKHNFTNRVMAFAGVSYNSSDNGQFANQAGTSGSTSFTGVGGGMRVSF